MRETVSCHSRTVLSAAAEGSRTGSPLLTADGGRAKVTACLGRLSKTGSCETDPDVAHLCSKSTPFPGLQHRSAHSPPPHSTACNGHCNRPSLPSPRTADGCSKTSCEGSSLWAETTGELPAPSCSQRGEDQGAPKPHRGSYTWWDSCGGSHCPPGTSPIASCIPLPLPGTGVTSVGGWTPGPIKDPTAPSLLHLPWQHSAHNRQHFAAAAACANALWGH